MKNYELIIIDMDGTLYDNTDMVKQGFETALNYLIEFQAYSPEEAEKTLFENHIYPDIREDARSATAYFMNCGYDIDHFDRWRSDGFDPAPIDKNKGMKTASLHKLREFAPLVLLSNNTIRNVEKTLNHLGIPSDAFTEIFCNEGGRKTNSKKPLMEELIKKYGSSAGNTLSIGDRYEVDGRPMNELGGDALILKYPQALELFLQGKESTDWHFFGGSDQ